ncbi:MAG: glycosyltransferase family 4 protein [Cypionkella sp.]
MTAFAFYAPLKPPTNPVPSGDRQMARALMLALEGEARVDLASDLRLYDGLGDANVQRALQSQAEQEGLRTVARAASQGWSAWISYHSYYKAPDILGPIVSRALGIPYVLIEATRAKKRLTGPWSGFEDLAEAAADHADLIFYLTDRDHEALVRDAPQGQKLVRLQPFLSAQDLPPLPQHQADPAVLLCVGMLRPGDKAASYQIVAEVLAQLQTSDWHLRIAGDGPDRIAIQAMFAPYGDRVTFLGQLDAAGVQREYAHASVLLWPGVNEAFGLVYLEAQAAGLPVVAQDRPGVRDVVIPQGLVALKGGAQALANATDALLQSPDLHRKRAAEGRRVVARAHLLGSARRTLFDHIAPLLAVAP